MLRDKSEVAAASEREANSRVPILLVDDNPSKRLALRAVLSPLGYSIIEADSGVAALRCVMAQDFAMILLDVRMPDMDGFETAAFIRQRPQSEITPIIFITAYGSDEIVNTDLYTAGAVDFIFAPVPPEQLRAKVSAFAGIFKKVEALATQARDVKLLADQFRLLTDAAPIGIFQTDRENRYLYTNPGWTEITGMSAEDAAGRPWDVILCAEERVQLTGDFAAEGAAEISGRFEIRREGTHTRVALVTSKAIPGQAGGIEGWVGTLADVTDEAAAEVAMSAARDAALAASEMQLNFTASASHELKTPTTSILGFLEEVLEGNALSEQDRSFLDIVFRNAQRLSQLIDDLLVLGIIDTDASMMHPEPVSLTLLAERVLSNLSGMAHDAGVSLATQVDPDVPLALADAERVEQAFTNLVSNAIKFTADNGAVTVSIRDGIDTVDVSVADTGIGIAPEDIENIFVRFFRTKLATEAAVKGTGLGLAIAKRMIEAQGGRLSVTSTVGAGSTFTMALPIADRTLEVVG